MTCDHCHHEIAVHAAMETVNINGMSFDVCGVCSHYVKAALVELGRKLFGDHRFPINGRAT